MIFLELKLKQIKKKKVTQLQKESEQLGSHSAHTGDLARRDASRGGEAQALQCCLTPSPFVPVKSVRFMSVTAHRHLNCSPMKSN